MDSTVPILTMETAPRNGSEVIAILMVPTTVKWDAAVNGWRCTKTGRHYTSDHFEGWIEE